MSRIYVVLRNDSGLVAKLLKTSSAHITGRLKVLEEAQTFDKIHFNVINCQHLLKLKLKDMALELLREFPDLVHISWENI